MVQCADKVLEWGWSSKSLAGHRRAGGLASLCGSPSAMSLQFGCIVDAVYTSPVQQDRARIRRASLNWKWREPWTRCPTKLSSIFPAMMEIRAVILLLRPCRIGLASGKHGLENPMKATKIAK